MGATDGLTITVKDSTGLDIITNELKVASGTIVTDEMSKGTNEVTTTIELIKSDNYGINNGDLTHFDDSLPLAEKIQECQSRRDLYQSEYDLSVKVLPKWKKELLELQLEYTSNKITYDEAVASGSASADELEEEKDELDYLKDQIEDALSEVDFHLNRIDKWPDMIDRYNQFLLDLQTYGNLKIEYEVESVGDSSEESEEESTVDLDNLDINEAPGMAISSEVTLAVSRYLEATVQSLIANGAANILGNLGINEENLELAQSILNLMNSAITKIECILPFIPKNIYMVPSAKIAMTSICTSLKDIYMTIYLQAENVYNETIGDAITNLPSTQEILKDALEVLLTVAENMIDEQCVKYTGKHLVELYYMCRKYLALYKKWKEARKAKKQAKEEQEAEEAATGIHEESYTKTKTKYSVSVDADAVKLQLLEELGKASDLIYNSFMIIQIQDAIQLIRDLIKLFNNIDLTVLTEGIDSLDDLINLLDSLGLNNSSAVLTLADAIKQGINSIANNVNGLTDQLKDQAIASSVSIAKTTLANTSVSSTKTTVKTFDFTSDTNTLTITINIYSNPTTSSFKKSLTSTLKNAKQKDGTAVFAANDIVTILNVINLGYTEKQDQSLELVNFNINIHFDIDGFNSTNSNQNYYDTTSKVQEVLNLQALDDAAEQQNALNKFELGVVTEEYTEDPTQAAQRPTFQLVHELFSVLSEIFPLLKTFLVLINNYKVNKAKVENHAQGNIFGMIKVLAKLNNLLKSLDTTKTNFYTIRTLKLYNWVTTSLKTPDSDTEILLDIFLTKKLYEYLKAKNYNYESINVSLETILYIDKDAIDLLRNELNSNINDVSNYFGEDSSLFVNYPDSKYQDGTTDGLDKVEIAGDTIYYSDSSLPLYGSQIMRCFALDLDPEQ